MDIHTKINESKSNLALGKKPYGILSAFHINIKWNGVGNPCQASLIKLDLDCHCIGLLNQMATVTQWPQSRHYTLHSIRCQEKHKKGHGQEHN